MLLVLQSKGKTGDKNNASNKNDIVLELGCGSGYPLAGHIAKFLEISPIRYLCFLSIVCNIINRDPSMIFMFFFIFLLNPSALLYVFFLFYFIDTMRYHGVDLSDAQIKMAQEEYPSMTSNFEVSIEEERGINAKREGRRREGRSGRSGRRESGYEK